MRADAAVCVPLEMMGRRVEEADVAGTREGRPLEGAGHDWERV